MGVGRMGGLVLQVLLLAAAARGWQPPLLHGGFRRASTRWRDVGRRVLCLSTRAAYCYLR